VNTSTFISLVALMMTVGCATKSPPLVVAYGHLVSQHDDIELRVARYEVSEIQRGHLSTNIVEVVFWRKTQTSELPQEAILILSRPLAVSPPIWHAIGGDASRGILPDTPTGRTHIASLADARVLDCPKAERLSRSRAEQIVRDHLRTGGVDLARMKLHLRRAEFGWTGSVSFPDEQGLVPIGGESYVGIRDCGDILYWTKGF
jgi:hypothetical protein